MAILDKFKERIGAAIGITFRVVWYAGMVVFALGLVLADCDSQDRISNTPPPGYDPFDYRGP